MYGRVTLILGLACVTLAGCLRAAFPERAPSPSPDDSAALFAAAVEHLGAQARGRLLVDPRPLRPGADLHRLGEDDIAQDSAIARSRAAVLRARGIAATDAVDDRRCTFSIGAGLPPDQYALLPDSVRRLTAACREREPYTTLVFGVATEVPDGEAVAGGRQIEAVLLTKGGYQIWNLTFELGEDGRWRVAEGEARFTIWS